MNLCRLFLTLFNLCFIYCLPLNALALSSRDIEVIPLVAEGTNCLSTTDGLNESGSPRQDKTRQDKTFIIVTLQVQLFGTQLARKR